MTAAVALYAIVIGVLLGGVGVLADRAAALGQRCRRWIWTSALAASIALPVAAPWRVMRVPDVSMMPVGSAAGAEAADLAGTPGTRASWTTVGAPLRARVDAVAVAGADLDPPLMGVWLASSAATAIVMLAGALALARRRRLWHEAVVNDEHVLVSPTTGPAVVGLVSPRIVLPEWALGLDAASLDLILRHEREHVRAGDPWLMHVAVLAVVVMPWNPLVWWMASRLRLAVELDCDARVLGTRGASRTEAVAYGELLLLVVQRRPRRGLFASPALVEGASSLAARISALFPDAVLFARTRAAAAIVTALAATGVALTVPLPRVAAAPAFDGVDTALSDVAPPQPLSAIEEPEVSSPIAPAAAQLASVPVAAIDTVPYASATTTRTMEAAIEAEAVDPRVSMPINEVPSELLVASGPIPPATLALPSAFVAPPPASAPVPGRTFDATTPGLVLPVLVRIERPRYTNAAMRERIAGRVVVEALVEADGRVGDVRVVESLDREFGLDAAAVEAAKQAVFRPGVLDGLPVPVAVAMELSFSIH
jgi:TonB family protein